MPLDVLGRTRATMKNSTSFPALKKVVAKRFGKSIKSYHLEEGEVDPKDGELCLCKTKSGETLMELKCTSSAQRSHKRCWFIQTAGRWPWKSESAKECVTTHLPNELALKMDCDLAGYLCSAIHVK
eukprot:maker-scaffold_151-snap-gene-0.2-mRNA-1 protein AED:0.46 eAED:0.47 QI:0/0/0/1/0/0/4/0/125